MSERQCDFSLVVDTSQPRRDERYMPGVDGRFRVGETELGDLLTRWLKLQQTDGQAIRLMLAASDRDDSPVNLRAHVVGLHVAAEWWHRHRFDGRHTAPADHNERVSRLLQAADANPDVSTDDVEWLKRKLQNSNNKSQLDRLLDIAGTVPDLMRDLVGDPEAMGEQWCWSCLLVGAVAGESTEHRERTRGQSRGSFARRTGRPSRCDGCSWPHYSQSLRSQRYSPESRRTLDTRYAESTCRLPRCVGRSNDGDRMHPRIGVSESRRTVPVLTSGCVSRRAAWSTRHRRSVPGLTSTDMDNVRYPYEQGAKANTVGCRDGAVGHRTSVC